MFGFHAPELIIILVIALLIFGPKKLPEMGSSIGRSIKEFQKGMKDISQPKDDDDEEDVKPVKSKAIERESVTREAGAGFEHVTVEKEVEAKPISSEVLPVESHVD
ncbi:MAG: twin-arginine translocase TatA/TatE family subunit [Ktedonobacteraceae bacterium]